MKPKNLMKENMKHFSDYRRKISLLLILLLSLSISSETVSSPQFLLEETIESLKKVKSLKANIKRFQFYNGETRISEGRVAVNDSMIVYNYTSPGKFRMIFTGRELQSFDLEKKLGRRESLFGECLLRESDPLGRFLWLRDKAAGEYKFKGSLDSGMVFVRCSEEGLTEYIGVNRESSMPSVIEWFDTTGAMIEQTSFNYRAGSIIPLSIVTRSMPGSILIDSMVISHPKINTELPGGEIEVPQGIRWDQER
jgi:hypothetical protein